MISLNLPTNKMFYANVTSLGNFYFLFIVLIRSSFTHLHKWPYFIDWEDHINSTPDGPNIFSCVWGESNKCAIITIKSVGIRGPRIYVGPWALSKDA